MNALTSVQLVVFDTDDARLRQLEDAARHLDCVEFVGGTGPAVTKKAKLDAMLVTPMRAERFGIGPPFPLAQARVHEARASDVNAGFPPWERCVRRTQSQPSLKRSVPDDVGAWPRMMRAGVRTTPARFRSEVVAIHRAEAVAVGVGVAATV